MLSLDKFEKSGITFNNCLFSGLLLGTGIVKNLDLNSDKHERISLSNGSLVDVSKIDSGDIKRYHLFDDKVFYLYADYNDIDILIPEICDKTNVIIIDSKDKFLHAIQYIVYNESGIFGIEPDEYSEKSLRKQAMSFKVRKDAVLKNKIYQVIKQLNLSKDSIVNSLNNNNIKYDIIYNEEILSDYNQTLKNSISYMFDFSLQYWDFNKYQEDPFNKLIQEIYSYYKN